MTSIDFGGAIMALLTGFILSAGLTGFVLASGGYQLPTPLLTSPVLAAGPVTGGAAHALTLPPAPAAVQEPAEFKVIATDLKFNPPTITAKVGQPITIVLDNDGAIEHDIAFPTIKADKPGESLKAVARPGQTATIEFTPTAAGTYEYVCTIPGHKEAGMKGVINVAE